MDEPPAKRPRRDDRDGDRDKPFQNTASPRPLHDSRTNGYDSRRRDTRDSDRRRNRSRSRSRSRSPVRERRRDRSRDRDRDRQYRDRRDRNERDFKTRKRSRSRSRSRSPPQRNGDGNGVRPVGRGNVKADTAVERDRKLGNVKNVKNENSEAMDLVPVEGEDEEAAMKRIMGFGNFRTTKNTKVPGNQIYGVRKEKKTTYRQYMNRVGGFNRPLSPTRM